MEKKVEVLSELIERLHKACIRVGVDSNEKRNLLEQIRLLYIDMESMLNSIADSFDTERKNYH